MSVSPGAPLRQHIGSSCGAAGRQVGAMRMSGCAACVYQSKNRYRTLLTRSHGVALTTSHVCNSRLAAGSSLQHQGACRPSRRPHRGFAFLHLLQLPTTNMLLSH